MSTNILSQCIYGCGACILSDKSRINDNNGVCRYARNKQKKHNYQAIEYSVAVSKIRASHKHNSMRKRDGSRRPTVGSNHIQVLRTSEGVVPYATAVGRFPRNDNVEHYAHQERYALNQKKLRDNEAKQATKAMRNESNKVKQNNEHYAADNDQNDEDISTVYCGSLNGDRSGRQFPISGRFRRRPKYGGGGPRCVPIQQYDQKCICTVCDINSNSTRKGDGSRRPTVGSNHVQVSRLPEGVVVPDVPYATAVGRFPRNEHYAPNQGQQINDNVEHYAPDNNAHQERYALNQKKLREETNEAKHATKAMRNESNKVKQNNEHYAPDNDEDISTVYCGSLNGDRSGRQLPNIWSISKTGSGRQLPISGRSRRPRSARPSYDEQCALIEKLTKELVEEKQANIAKSDEFNQVNQRHVQISNELNRVKQINAQMRQDNQAMLAELNLVKKSYAHLQHQLSNILSNHPRSG
eukprot:533571_1